MPAGDGNLLLFMARQLPKKSFRSSMLANLKAHRWPSMRGGCGGPGPAEPG